MEGAGETHFGEIERDDVEVVGKSEACPRGGGVRVPRGKGVEWVVEVGFEEEE